MVVLAAAIFALAPGCLAEHARYVPPPCAQGNAAFPSFQLQSSAKTADDGARISTVGYAATGWCSGTSSSTVLGDLVKDGLYPDIFFSDNLRAYFGEVPVPTLVSPDFTVPWWYRTELALASLAPDQAAFLELDGVSYRASLWVNGTQIGWETAQGGDLSRTLVGTHRSYRFDVTKLVHPGANAVALEVWAPENPARDLTIFWNDESHPAPDGGMGIRRAVRLVTTGTVAVVAPHVTTKLDLPALDRAHLTVVVPVENTAPAPVHATVRVTIGSVALEQEVDLAASEARKVAFDPASFPALDIAQPKVWWPAQYGEQPLYELDAQALVAGVQSDAKSVRFGIRDVAASLTPAGHRLYAINGKRILVRGAAWNGDMLNAATPERLEDELRYAKDLGLNAIRIEGHFEPDVFYDLLDRYGLLLLPGWNCCDGWQRWSEWSDEETWVAMESMRNQARRLRNHPCVLDFLVGSDEAPPEPTLKAFMGVLEDEDWPNPVAGSARDTVSATLGANGMEQGHPYDWVPPIYWYEPHPPGGAIGWNTEVGPGPSIPTSESLRAMLSDFDLVELASGSRAALYHAGWTSYGTGKFAKLDVFHQAMDSRLGPARSLDDYVQKAQLLNYEAHRAMFEAWSRNQYADATGVIFWMLNSAWPSLIWHSYDYRLQPAGSYFGIKKANESLHVQYSYDDASVIVANHSLAPVSGLSVRAVAYGLDGVELERRDATVDVGGDATASALSAAGMAAASPYFLDLTLTAADGTVRSRNLYWLSAIVEELDWSQQAFTYTPATTHADFTALPTLAPSAIVAALSSEAGGGDVTTRVTLENPTDRLAFFVRLRLLRGEQGAEVLPVRWDDDWLSLAPHERRTVSAVAREADFAGARPVVEITGYNVPKLVVQ